MSQSGAGRRRAWPCRDASITAWEQIMRTVGSAATTGWSKVRTVMGRMAIANVSQVCGWSQPRGLAVELPADVTIPAKHSGDAGQRARATRSAAAGQPALVVRIP